MQLLIKRKLRYLGYIERSGDLCLQRTLLHRGLDIGKRNIGRTLLGYRDSLKHTLRLFGITISAWSEIALNKRRWRSIYGKKF